MNKYICLLRGINVSGKNIIKMDALKSALECLGFAQVKTYIQSGNIVFLSIAVQTHAIEALINEKIKEVFQLEIPVLVIHEKDFKAIILANKFLKESNIDVTKLHITYLSQEPLNADIAAINTTNFGNDQFEISSNAIFLYCPNGYGNTKLTNTFFEKKLKVSCTTRNWNTVLKLAEMLNEIN